MYPFIVTMEFKALDREYAEMLFHHMLESLDSPYVIPSFATLQLKDGEKLEPISMQTY